MVQLNSDFAPSKIQFCYTTEFINNTTYRHFADSEKTAMKNTYADSPSTQLNVYVVNIEAGYLGVGTFPWDPDSLGNLGGLIIDDDWFGAGNKTLTHEVGHCVGLWHTHHGVSEFNNQPCFLDSNACDCPCYERADGTDSDTTGDFCADTAPTPRNYYCVGPGRTDSCSGTPWGPTDPQNYMGYADDFCYTEYSPHQFGRMHCWAESELTGWECGPNTPTGACCISPSCSIETEAGCDAGGGIYLGDETNCDGACLEPLAPTDLRVDKLWAQALDLCWTDNSGNEDGFRIAISRDGSNWDNDGEVGRDVTCYRASDLTPSTLYYFRVRAFNDNGFSDPNPVISVTTRTGLPDPPSNLRMPNIWAQALDLCWDDNSHNEDGFRIAISRDNSNWDNHGEVGRDVTCYRASGLTPSTLYYFRVRASNEDGFSDPNPVISVTTRTGLPDPPSNLRVPNIWAQALDLCWDDNSHNEDGFRIAISRDNSNWDNHGEVGRDVTCYRASGLTPSTLYYFRVRAFNDNGFSDPNPVISVTTKSGLPNAPTDLRVDNLWAQALDLCWTDNSHNEDSFRIAISRNGSNWDNHGEVGRDVTCYRASGLTPSTLYYFRVRASNEDGFSDPNPVISATTRTGLPDPPSNLRVPNIWAQALDLCWNDNSHNEDGFRIAISGDGSNWDNHGEVGRDVTCYRASGLTPGTLYYFRVRASNEDGFSDPNPVISVTTRTGLSDPPNNLRVPNIWAHALDLCWDDNSDNEDGFRIAMSRAGGNWDNLVEVGANVTCHRASGLASNTGYCFKVRAQNQYGFSEFSNVICVTTRR